MKTPIERMMEEIDWMPVDGVPNKGEEGLPYATHAGVLSIGGMRLRCYRLNTGEAILDADDVNNFFGVEDDDDRAV